MPNALLLGAFLAAPSLAVPTLSVESRARRPGEVLLVTVSGHDPQRPPQASLRGQPLDFFAAADAGAWLALAAFDLEAATGPARLEAVLRAPGGGPLPWSETLLLEPASFPRIELKVAQRYVTPAKNDAERAEGEAARLQRLFVRGEEGRLFEGRFESPIPGAATARFGERRVFNGQPRAPHSGMDLKAPLGAPVKAPAAGRVVLAGSLFYQGKTVVLDHGLGLTTLYAHLSRIRVKSGERVRKGRLIGNVGASGRATGPHLHWALKLRGARVDPYSLIFLDLDAKLRWHPEDSLKRSAYCGDPQLPPPTRWGPISGGLRARSRPLQASYPAGEPVTLLIEIQNVGLKPAFLDFVRDSALRPIVLGLGSAPRPFETLISSRAASGPLTEQVRIPSRGALCFEQGLWADGPLLAGNATSYALSYSTDLLYPSTASVRAGVWRGRLSLPELAMQPSTTAPGNVAPGPETR